MTALPARAWIAAWRLLRRYHRYTVTGIEHLDAPGAALVVGYHGRPFAFDMCMLMVSLYERLGYFPHGVIHRGVEGIAPLRWLTQSLGAVTADGPALARAVERGEHIVVTPGGEREGCRSFRDRYRVAWDGRVGYLRLALKYDLPIVPVAAAGADDTYVGLNDGWALGRRLGLPSDWAFLAWIGVGPLGIFPFSPPFPVRLRQMVGEPIDLRAEGAPALDDREGLLRLHGRVADAVQALLDRVRAG